MTKEETEPKTKITGHVTDEKGRPLGGVTVACNGTETKTLFDGSYKFEGHEPGTHTVEIAMEGYRRHRRQILTDEGEEAILDFRLDSEAGVAKIYGYVLDGTNREPVSTGGSVYMYRHTFNRHTPIDPKTGYFEFAHLPPGTYTIWTSILEYEDEKKTVVVKEGEERREEFLIRKADIEPPLG